MSKSTSSISTNSPTNNLANPSPIHPLTQYAALLTSSVAFQPFITLAAKLNAGKVTANLPYTQILNNTLSMPFGCFVEDSFLIFRRRAFASLMPAAITSYLSTHQNMNPAQSAALNAVFETVIAQFLESQEKFNLANRKYFPLVDNKGMGPNLAIVDRQTFNQFKLNSGITNPDVNFDELEKRRISFKSNLPAATVALALRNVMFGSAIFLAGPLAKNFASKHHQDFQGLIGQDTLEGATKHGLRFALASATTPFDGTFTRLCSGQFTVTEVVKTFKDPRKMFSGGLARGFQGFFAASSIVYGIELSKHLNQKLEQYFDQDQKLESSLFTGLDLKREEAETARIITDLPTEPEEQKSSVTIEVLSDDHQDPKEPNSSTKTPTSKSAEKDKARER